MTGNPDQDSDSGDNVDMAGSRGGGGPINLSKLFDDADVLLFLFHIFQI